MKIELFYAPGCDKCAANRENLKAAASQCIPDVEWCELNVLEHMEYAVELGVLTLPAIAIEGVLEFPALPNVKQFAAAIARKAASVERS
ncbi:thioredoxin family protein [Massilia norwichensis]|uniref:Thioredoxin family protein n=1 Tax=Massilia norwichensis TaxID=1442366 RepID=A0ABT2A281_9BURK|nr:thioredoxin family protein [Massilia putida]MCS0588298.1 thioredoxin family protein [Massilia norwichensis]